MKKRNISIIIILVIIILLLGTLVYGYYKKVTMEVKNPIVTMEVEGYGTIKLELYPQIAPETVANFVNLAQNGFYDGLTFHRVVEGFMIQGGGYKVVTKEVTNEETGEVTIEDTSEAVEPTLSNLGIEVKQGEKDSTYCIKGEFLENGYNNTLRHKEGVISMARADYTQKYSQDLVEESYNSATSQFFIMTKDNTYLDGNYAAFGKVIEGMDIVHKIESVEVKKSEGENSENENAEESTPVDNIIITSVKVDTQGVTYNKPETLTPWNYTNWLYEMYGIDLNNIK